MNVAAAASILSAIVVCISASAIASDNRPPAPPEVRLKTHVQAPNQEAGWLHTLQGVGLSVQSQAEIKYEETPDLGLVADQDGVGRRYFYFDTGKEIRVVASFTRAEDAVAMTLAELAVHVVEHDATGFIAGPATTDTFLGLPSATASGSFANRHLSARVFWHPAIEQFVAIAALSKSSLAAANLERQEWESTMQLMSE